MGSKPSKTLGEDYYDFNRGRCIIFNQMHFDVPGLKVRNGTNVDRDECEKLFKSLNFEVQVNDDFTVDEIKGAISKVANEDHSSNDCLAICFFSHGDEDMLYGKDRNIAIDELTDQFKADECIGLAGKPKLFIIQACRGSKDDPGVELQKDSDDLMYRIPTTSDFLVCWASTPGYISWRGQKKGSWFIRSFVTIMESQKYEEDFVSIMTKVNRHMIQTFETPSNPAYNEEGNIEERGKRKQCATTLSTLQRKLMFSDSNN